MIACSRRSSRSHPADRRKGGCNVIHQITASYRLPMVK